MKKIFFLFTCIFIWFFFTAIAMASQPFPDTGQTTCYDENNQAVPCDSIQPGDPYYGQDGHYQPRLPRSYTKLGHGGVVLADGALHVDDGGPWIMTRDNVTGLIWEIKSFANNSEKYSWDDAAEYVKQLKLGGFSDWRLPNIKELHSLLYSGRSQSNIDRNWFPNTVASLYWSSTPYSHSDNSGWLIDFKNGHDIDHYKVFSAHVRAVRGGESVAETFFIYNGDGTITDTKNGLMWMRCNLGETWYESGCSGLPEIYNWKEALFKSQRISFAGYTDWRLPNRNELKTLVDHSKTDMTINTSIFPTTPTANSWYWTSTTNPNGVDSAWLVYFIRGNDANGFKVNYAYARAVRTVPREDIADRHKANIIFNWIESLFPGILFTASQRTHKIESIYYRYYPCTNVYIGVMDNNLYYYDEQSILHNLGNVDYWQTYAQGSMDEHEIKKEIVSLSEQILSMEEIQILKDALKSATTNQIYELKSAIHYYLNSLERAERLESKALLNHTKSIGPRVTRDRIKKLYDDLFGDIINDEVKAKFLNYGLGFNKEKLGGYGGSLNVVVKVGGTAYLEKGHGSGVGFDFLNFTRFDYPVGYAAHGGGVAIGYNVDLSAHFSKILSEGFLFRFHYNDKYIGGPSKGTAASIGISAKMLKGLGFDLGLGVSRNLEGQCNVKSPSDIPTTLIPLDKYGFNIATKASFSSGVGNLTQPFPGKSANLSANRSFSCSGKAENVHPYLDKNDPKKLDTIIAGTKMAGDIFTYHFLTGSIQAQAAALTAILYGYYYDKSLIDGLDDEQFPKVEVKLLGGNVVHQLGEWETQYTHIFEAQAYPSGNYRYEWDFGNSLTYSETRNSRQNSLASNTYSHGIYTVEVELYDVVTDELLASDSVTITVVQDYRDEYDIEVCEEWRAANSGGHGTTVDVWDISILPVGAVFDIQFNARNIPDKLVVQYEGQTVLDTGWRGSSNYDGNPLYPGGIAGSGAEMVEGIFSKSSQNSFTVTVYGPQSDTVWDYSMRARCFQ